MSRPQMRSGGSVSRRLHTTGGGEASVSNSHSRKDGLRWQQPVRTKVLPAKKKPEELLSRKSK
ncbi:unnamed protein product [Brassica oleracea]|uniref:(rape) hypothetical protein n=1 Tax=Brassica napus TaxID=3708 RepID=A0A816UXG0_BRANA|nr:unnamed protein product [Brassica napus]